VSPPEGDDDGDGGPAPPAAGHHRPLRAVPDLAPQAQQARSETPDGEASAEQ
jgi:hypothetical protein